jgi:hypothetical protein
MTNRDRFNKLQSQIRELDQRKADYAIDLRVRYRDPHYAKPAERKRLDAFDARIDKLATKLFEIIDLEGGRKWDSGVPWHWILTCLSYDDMTTHGQLSVIPPPAYGFTAWDMQRFAYPVQQSEYV